MEEFRSTEILDKEIAEDARHKAEKLIARAKTDGQRLLEENKAKMAQTAEEKKALYAKRLESYKTDLAAALPLEKERFLVSFEAGAVEAAIAKYVSALPEAKKLELLALLLERYKSVIGGKPLSVLYSGLSQAAAKKLVEGALDAKAAESYKELSEAEAKDAGLQNGMIIETADGLVRCRLAISELVDELLDAKRFELANALFDGRLSE